MAHTGGRKPLSSSSSRDGRTPSSSSKCPDMKTISTYEFLCYPEKLESKEVVEDVIHKISQHQVSGCRCVTPERLSILLGNAFFTKFFVDLNEYKENVRLLEKAKCRDYLMRSEEDKSEKGHTATSPLPGSDKPSSLDDQCLNELVNTTVHDELLYPLREAVTHWKNALLTENRSIKNEAPIFKLHDHIRAAFYIFQVYHELSMLEICISLMTTISTKARERIVLGALRLHLALYLGYYDYALETIHETNEAIREFEQGGISQWENPDCIYFFLLRCELEVRLNDFTSVEALQALVNSKYLQQPTPQKYFLLALALTTASCYPGEVFASPPSLSVFTEPTYMMYHVLKGSDKNTFDTPDKNHKDERSDPIYLKYMTIHHWLKSFPTFIYFSMNSGSPASWDSTRQYNFMMRACRHNCLLYWMRVVLCLGARVDQITDKDGYAAIKLMEALNLFKHGKGMAQACTRTFSFGGDENENCDPNDGFKISSRLLKDKKSYDEEESDFDCLHTKSVTPWRQKLEARSSTETTEESPLSIIEEDDLLNFKPDQTTIFEADATKLECIILAIILKYSNSVSNTANMLNRISLSNSVSVSLGIVKEIMNKLSPKLPREMKSQVMENARQLFTGRLRALTYCIFLKTFINCGNKTKGTAVVNILFKTKYAHRIDCLEGYPSRVQFSEFLILYAQLIKESKYPSRRLEYIPSLVERSYSSAIMISKEASSPVLRTKRKTPIPCAPKGKNPYKMEELGEYFKKLSETVTDNDDDEKHRSEDVCSVKNERNESPVAYYRKFMEDHGLSPLKPQKLVPSHQLKSALKPSSSKKTVTFKGSKEVKAPVIVPNLVSEVAEMPQSSEQVALLAQRIKKYWLNHPPVDIFRQLCLLLSEYHLSQNANPSQAAFYLSETISLSFRYYAMKTAVKRDKKNKEVRHPSEIYAFDSHRNDYTSLISEALRLCPPGYRIVQIQTTNCDSPKKSPDLILTCFEHGRDPLFLQVKFDQQKHQRYFMTEMIDIIKQSNVSIVKRDPETFWKMRHAVDSRLKILIESVQQAWLGPFIGLFLGKINDNQFQRAVQAAVFEIIETSDEFNCKCLDKGLLTVLVESSTTIKKDMFCQGIGFLFNCYNSGFFSKCYAVVKESFSDLDLSSNDNPTDLRRSPVGLILGSGLDLFPWESLPLLRVVKQEFFRIPSMRFLAAAIKAFSASRIHVKGANGEKTFFIVNPEGNLKKTEDRFKTAIEAGRKKGWSGCVGRSPSSRELADGLETNDIYLYLGHGSGTRMFKCLGDGLEGINLSTASLVIGCSSGRLRQEGHKVEPYGHPYRFLLNGAPTYVGALWDVTDTDIDKFSDHMMEKWMPYHWKRQDRFSMSRCKGVSLPRAVSDSRDICKLQSIIGAATVVYGLPLFTCFSSGSSRKD